MGTYQAGRSEMSKNNHRYQVELAFVAAVKENHVPKSVQENEAKSQIRCKIKYT